MEKDQFMRGRLISRAELQRRERFLLRELAARMEVPPHKWGKLYENNKLRIVRAALAGAMLARGEEPPEFHNTPPLCDADGQEWRDGNNS